MAKPMFYTGDMEDAGLREVEIVVPKPKRGSDSRLMKIAEKYTEMLSNGRILSNRAAMEVLDGRVRQLAERIDLNDAPDRMGRLNALWQEFRDAYKNDKGSDMVVAVKKLDNEFEKAYHDYKSWEQLMQLFDLRRKLVDSEVKTIKEIKLDNVWSSPVISIGPVVDRETYARAKDFCLIARKGIIQTGAESSDAAPTSRETEVF